MQRKHSRIRAADCIYIWDRSQVTRVATSLDQFAQLCESLGATTRKLEKRRQIAEWLRSLPAEDSALGALYLSGRPFPETDPRSLNLGGAILSKALEELSGANRETMRAAYRRHGDLGAAAFDLLQGKTQVDGTLTLASVDAVLNDLASARGAAAKLPLLLSLLKRTTPVEAKYLVKLFLGDMRIGVKQSLVEEGIAEAYKAEPDAVRRAVMLNGNLAEVVSMAAAGRLEEARVKLFHPLGFMLASPVASVGEALGRFAQEIKAEHAGVSEALPSTEQGKTSPLKLASEELALREAQMEDKYDGIRAQLHCGDPQQSGRVALFSRNREDITESFPELVEAFAQLQEPVILDGEILAWDPAAQRALPFSSLQQRLGRRRVTDEMRRQAPVVFMTFDMLSRRGDLLLEQPLSKRREALAEFVATYSAVALAGTNAPRAALGQGSLFEAAASEESEAFSRLVLAPAVRLANADQLEQAYADARARGNEGVMLKALHSIYQPGRRGLAWLKLKRELATLDVVVTAAEYGHGKRNAVLSDYTFAVRDGDDLKNVGKAYSGLTDAEIDELTAFFLDHTVEDFGHVRTVEPLIVLEVAFNNVMRSERHASGFALRFPRILRIRTDKPVEEIDTLERVEEIYASQPDRPIEPA
jgi:DNA ligase 1